MKSIAKIAAMIVLVASPTVLAQWPRYMPPAVPKTPDGKVNLDAPVPRAADGKPDLSGVWDVVPCIDCPAARRRPGPWRGAPPAPAARRRGRRAGRGQVTPRGRGGGSRDAAAGAGGARPGDDGERRRRIFPEARRISRGRPTWSRSGWPTTARTIPTRIVCRSASRR